MPIFRMEWMIDCIVVSWVMLIKSIHIYTIIQHSCMMHAWVMRTAIWAAHFFIEVHQFLGTVLLFGTLMWIAMMSMLLLKFANWFHHAFDGGSGAWDLVDGGGVGSLGRAGANGAGSGLIVSKSMVEFGMRLEYTLRSLIHFLDVFINMLNSLMWLGHRLIRCRNNRKSICWINILYNLTVVVEIWIVTHTKAVFIDASIICQNMWILDTQPQLTLIVAQGIELLALK